MILLAADGVNVAQNIGFGIIAVFMIVAALNVVTTKNVVHAALSLALVLAGMAAQYILAAAEFVAVSQVMVYIGAVMATKLFASAFPQWFGDLGSSAYSLFQIMTLESWSMGIVRPVMREFPFAWVFFLPFILVATFMMLNLFIAVIVNAMQSETDKAAQERAEQGHDERVVMLEEIRRLRATVDLLVSRTGN